MPLEFVVRFDVDTIEESGAVEIERILLAVIDKVRNGTACGSVIMDINGNSVGRWQLQTKTEERNI